MQNVKTLRHDRQDFLIGLSLTIFDNILYRNDHPKTYRQPLVGIARQSLALQKEANVKLLKTPGMIVVIFWSIILSA